MKAPPRSTRCVPNHGSGNVFAFSIDADAGTLTSLGNKATVNNPAYVGQFTIP